MVSPKSKQAVENYFVHAAWTACQNGCMQALSTQSSAKRTFSDFGRLHVGSGVVVGEYLSISEEAQV